MTGRGRNAGGRATDRAAPQRETTDATGTRRRRGTAAVGTTRAVWTMLLLPPVALGALTFGYAVLAGISPGDPGAEVSIRAALPGILAVNHLALFGLLVFLLRRRGGTLREIGWSARAVDSTVAREAGVGLACALGLYLFKELAVDPVDQILAGQRPTFTSLFDFRPGSLDVALATAATLLVFVEESIYRGYALPFVEERGGTARAVLVTSVAFGFLHWGNGPVAVLVTGILGVLIAGVFLWRRNLVAPTVAHAFYNLAVLLT